MPSRVLAVRKTFIFNTKGLKGVNPGGGEGLEHPQLWAFVISGFPRNITEAHKTRGFWYLPNVRPGFRYFGPPFGPFPISAPRNDQTRKMSVWRQNAKSFHGAGPLAW